MRLRWALVGVVVFVGVVLLQNPWIFTPLPNSTVYALDYFTVHPYWYSVPLYTQLNPSWCGQASMQMLLEYYGVRMSQWDIAQRSSLGPSYLGSYVGLVRDLGLVSEFTSDPGVVASWLAGGPVLVHDLSRNHVVVAYGVGLDGGLLVNDPLGWSGNLPGVGRYVGMRLLRGGPTR